LSVVSPGQLSAQTDNQQRATDNYCRWSKEAQNNQNLAGNQSFTGFKVPQWFGETPPFGWPGPAALF
jgi:hypothetical protein